MESNLSSLNLSSVYTLRPLAEKAKDFKVSQGNRLCRVIFKGKDAESKKAQFCQLPELTDSFAQAFMLNAKGLELVKEMIEGLQDKAVKNVFVQHGRSATQDDLTIEKLCEVAESDEDNIRCSKPNIEKAFDATYKNRIALSIALERDAEAALILTSEDNEAIAQFWDSEAGLKYLTIAGNYKQFILMAAERKPIFSSQALKDKILTAISYLDSDTILVDKITDKLTNAPVASADLENL